MYFDLHLVNIEYSRQILKNTQTSNFMKIRPMSGKLFYADEWTDGQTDRHDEGNSLFRNFANAPKNGTEVC